MIVQVGGANGRGFHRTIQLDILPQAASIDSMVSSDRVGGVHTCKLAISDLSLGHFGVWVAIQIKAWGNVHGKIDFYPFYDVLSVQPLLAVWTPGRNISRAGSWLPVVWASLSVVYGFEVMCVSLGSPWMTLSRRTKTRFHWFTQILVYSLFDDHVNCCSALYMEFLWGITRQLKDASYVVDVYMCLLC